MKNQDTEIISWITVNLFLLLVLSGCVSGSVNQQGKIANGQVYGVTKGLFNHRWWNYHERGISFADGQFWQDAENDLKTALKQRDKDQRRARTYGMHFVDYFPHRELGIVYYKSKRYEEALVQLRQSLSDEESAKAKYYLNLTRKEVVSREKSDCAAPIISQLAWPESQFVNTSRLPLKGVVSDDTFVQTIAVNNKPLFIELAEKRIPFEYSYPLVPGENTIILTATDIVGRTSSVKRTVVLDLYGPTISIDEIIERPDKSYLVTGSVNDNTGISSVYLDGQKQAVSVGAKEFSFELVIPGTNLAISAQDLAGNRSSDSIDMQDKEMLAVAGWPEKRVMVASLDFQLAGRESSPTHFRQKTGPIFTLKSFSDYQEIFLANVLLEGRILSSNEVVSIEINGFPLDFKPGKRLYINHIVQLKEGENVIPIVVRDSSGAEYKKEITFVKKTTKPRDIGSRMVLVVIPFSQLVNNGDLAELVFDFFQTKLVEQNRFHLVTRRDLDLTLQELKLSSTKLVDPANAVRIGKMVAADNIISGKMYHKDSTIEVTINTIDTETSTIVASLDVYSESIELLELQYLMEGLSLKLGYRFPLLDGLIIKIKGDKYYLDQGKRSGIRPETEIVIYRDKEPIYHPITEKFLGVETEELGILEVTNVLEDFSIAKFDSGDAKLIKKMDKFITR